MMFATHQTRTKDPVPDPNEKPVISQPLGPANEYDEDQQGKYSPGGGCHKPHSPHYQLQWDDLNQGTAARRTQRQETQRNRNTNKKKRKIAQQ